jgi:hypothetical protein
MSGWGRGYCNSAGTYNAGWPRLQRGRGFGYGRDRGYRRIFWDAGLTRLARRRVGEFDLYLQSMDTRKNEMAMLHDEAKALQEDLDAIQKRIKELEGMQSLDE